MTVRLSDYLHLRRGIDTTPALPEALLQCKNEADSTLVVDKGIYPYPAVLHVFMG